MAKVSQFVGSEWVAGSTLPVSWQFTRWGSMSKCGSLTVTSVSDFATNFNVDVSIEGATFNENISITLNDQNPESTSGPYSITIGSGGPQNSQYKEGSANNPHDYPGGTAILLDGASYNGHGFSAQIWQDGGRTLLYIDAALSFWLLVG
jgi:hypothetical protein